MKKIKILVVDDSALMRKIISDMINEENDMEVVGIARNGQDLMNKLSSQYAGENKPDVITLDVEMPRMNGIHALEEMKNKNINIPTIVLSSVSREGVKLTMECLHAGAFDFIAKPSGNISNINGVKSELVKRIKMASRGKNAMKISEFKSNHTIVESRNIGAIVIGASTGGPKALYSVITKLPENLGVPTMVVQHMPAGFTKAFAERLNTNSNQKVVEAEDNMEVEPNAIYIAPGGFHMEVFKDKRIHLNKEPAIWGVRPAVDKLFISASEVYGKNLISVVLTGMGRDGADGTSHIKDKGGITISQDESTCVIYGMPKAAYSTGKVDMVLKLDKITDELVKLVHGSRR
ncbi:chemotaxis-specific protein-glutamate methyltransferase CheB [Clostridium tyrobutyricum]|uniref:chemotaxis-specific protein-glutamate methyltransferase CheB n=1 Tax=Clostridium tyrobutyricum TaxID=1519 RepID=UPI0018AC7F5D